MAWLTPRDPDELAGMLAGRKADDPPLLPTGAAGPRGGGPPGAPGGSPPSGARTAAADDARRRLPEEADVVSAASLAGLRELRPRDLTAAAGAGTRVPDLLTALADEGVWVPLGGPALGMSVGGLAAVAPAGPFDASRGNLKRQLLACGLVGWDGETLRWGRAVMKDVAGYSMVRSVTGGFGRTGVVHRATFRLWPAPEALATPAIRPAEEAGGPLAVAGALALSDVDAAVRPDAAVWSWSAGGSGDSRRGGRLELRLVGSEASVALRLEKLRGWAVGRGLELSGDETRGFDPLAAGSGGHGARSAADGPAAGLPPAGSDRDPGVSLVAVRAGRAAFPEAARRIRRVLGDRALAMEGYPLAGRLRCAYRRAEGKGDGGGRADPPAGGPGPSPAAKGGSDPSDGPRGPAPLHDLLDVVGEPPVRVERGSARELAAADARRAEGARRLEARVQEELAGRPRHWMSAYL